MSMTWRIYGVLCQERESGMAEAEADFHQISPSLASGHSAQTGSKVSNSLMDSLT